jgi:flagellin-like protein
MKQTMFKKGISPLIATVLIIGFTVALAAMVMTWGSGFIKKTTEQTEESTSIALKCASDLAFEISRVTCDDTKHLKSAMVENRGKLDITSVKFRIIDDEGVDVQDMSGPISAFGAKNFDGFTSTKSPHSIEAIASVSGGTGKGDIICSQVVEKFQMNC